MDGGSWAAIIVASLSLLAGLYTARTASRASISTTKTQAETEAYNRARKMDTDTIEKQEKKIEKLENRVQELETKVDQLKEANETLNEDNDRLRNKMNKLENLESRLRDLGYSVD